MKRHTICNKETLDKNYEHQNRIPNEIKIACGII
jgi:hypothetical protein